MARFTEDSRYYRSQILSIQNEMAEILFVDYGNQQDTPLSQLKRITPRFMEFPVPTDGILNLYKYKFVFI